MRDDGERSERDVFEWDIVCIAYEAGASISRDTDGATGRYMLLL